MSRSQSNEVIEDGTNFLVMVYDSASGESYLYDIVNKTFAPIDTTNIETIDNIFQTIYAASDLQPLGMSFMELLAFWTWNTSNGWR